MGHAALVHLRHHLRFYGASLLGLACFFAMPGALPLRLLVAGDLTFAIYLIAMSMVVATFTAQDLRARAADEDVGIALTLLVVLAAIGFCCSAVFAVLSIKKGLGTVPLALAIAAVPLGWATLHTVAAFHYANLFYAPSDAAAKTPPLIFPGMDCPADCPSAWDFLYFAFVVGMTFQVSDVQIAAAQMRRATLGHSIVSFFFNTAIIAMAVNAAVNLTS